MKILFTLVFLILFSIFQLEAKVVDTSLESFHKLEWKQGLNRAFKEAKRENKNVIVMVEDFKCKWCIKMKKGALSDRRIQEILKGYVLVKVARSNKPESSQLNGFDGTIPNLYFMTKDKEIVENIVGYFTADDFLGYIQEIKEDGF